MATYTNAVQQLYVAYFNRPADAAGLAYWEGVVTAAKGDTKAVSAAFSTSTEYQTEYSQINTSGVITKIYENLFGHAPDTAGLAYWVKAVGDKVFTIDQAVTKIAAGAQGSDKVAYESKVVVATAFTASLDATEAAGYTGTAANVAAKDYLSTIVTAADATAAIVPAKLDTAAAAIVKAGIPFSLTGSLATLAAANAAQKAFLVTADGDKIATTSADKAMLDGRVVAADLLVAGEVGATYAGSAGVKAAALADQQEKLADDLATAQGVVGDAIDAIADHGVLAGYLASDTAADAAALAAAKVATIAGANLTAALTTFNTNQAVGVLPVTVGPNGDVTGLITYTASSKSLSLAAGVTEVTNPGITALFNASVALENAQKADIAAAAVALATQINVNRSDVAAGAATTALLAVGAIMTTPHDAAGPTAAQIATEISVLKAATVAPLAAKTLANEAKVIADAVFAAIAPAVPTQAQIDARDAATTTSTNADTAYNLVAGKVTTFNNAVAAFDLADNSNPLAKALSDAEAAVTVIVTDIKDLSTAVAKLDAANALVAELKALDAAIKAAGDVFVDHGFVAPVTLSPVHVATSGDDIFLAGKSSATLFSMSDDDALFIGADYALNAGKPAAGNNAVLEIFVAQSGANTVITMETEAYGSASGDTITITLTGVTATDVHFANGIITV